MTTSKCCKLSNGSELWLKNKKLHREDGPAILNKESGYVGFFIKGKRFTITDWLDKANLSPSKKTFIFLKYNDRDRYKNE